MSLLVYKRYGNMRCGFGWRSCFKGSKSGVFELEESRLRSASALERMYLVAAVALLYSTTQGKPTCKSLAFGNRLILTGDAG